MAETAESIKVTPPATRAMVTLIAETPIHAGAGQSSGVIDLPIQREAHTAWPCIYGSGVKGALRQRAEDWAGTHSERQAKVAAVFGPETAKANEHAGAVMVSDASILLLPVRSLTTHFRWVTCPAVLERHFAACRRTGLSAPKPFRGTPGLDEAWHASTGAEIVYLEEFRFNVEGVDLKELLGHWQSLLQPDTDDALTRRLIVVHDDRFRWFAEHAAAVAAHVALNERKTVQGGALWYEETLPPETVLYAAIEAAASRGRTRDNPSTMAAHEVLKFALDVDASFTRGGYLRLGGNETLGMGWCRMNSQRRV